MCVTGWAQESVECKFISRSLGNMFKTLTILPGTVDGSTMPKAGEWLFSYRYMSPDYATIRRF
jgi:hypothetical protein